MSNPEVRQLMDAFAMSCNHAYGVWQWMVQQGYYPLEAEDPTDIKKSEIFMGYYLNNKTHLYSNRQ